MAVHRVIPTILFLNVTKIIMSTDFWLVKILFPVIFSAPVTALYSLKYRDKNLFAEVLFAHPTCPSALVYFMNMYFPMF